MNEMNKENSNFTIGSRLMVHFRHLKKIFQNGEQEAKKEMEILAHNLEEWLNEKAKPLTEDIGQQTEGILMRINEEAQKARINVEILENVKLQNPNIPFKAKQYMEGNRKAYARAINSFLGHMEINNKNYFYLVDFCRQFDEIISDLNRGTLRSYTILQEFFANETSKIAQNLKNFDILFKELSSTLNDERMVAVNNLIKKVQSLNSKIKQKINTDVDFKSSDAILKLAAADKESIMSDIINFENSSEHSSFLSLNEEKKNKERDFYENQSLILQSFSVLERPLRKYSHIAFEHEEIVLEYLKQPVETLANDRELRILDILKNLEKMLNEGQIQVDERKKEKAVEEIKKISKNFIEQFVKKYYSFKAEIEELDNKIKSTRVAEKFRDFNKKLEEINSKIEKNNEEYNKLKEDIIKIDGSISDLKNEIESSAKEIFGEEINISI